MVIGFCGSGSMAAAIARGWVGAVDTMLFSDGGSGRAAELAAEVGGRAVGSNAELADAADVLILAVKPARMADVAAQIGDSLAKPLVSILGATSLDSVRSAFPNADVFRVMPNIAVEVRHGVLCVAGGESAEVRGLLDLLGKTVDLPDSDFDAATAIMGCAPAYLALAVEALADAGAEAGLDEALAIELVVETTAGTAELLEARHPADVRKAVASPGGSTEAGLEALDRANAREAFTDAVRASLKRMKP